MSKDAREKLENAAFVRAWQFDTEGASRDRHEEYRWGFKEGHKHGFDAGYQAGSEGRWVLIRSVDDLPKESGYYAVTLTPSDFHEEVEVAYFHFSTKSWSRAFGSPLHTSLNVGSVIAWMPLPPAYKED